MCPECKHKLSWQDNIPLVSFIILRGRCRYCKKPISWQYPTVELVTATATIFLWHSPIALLVAYVFIVIFFSDWIYGLIPDEMIVVGIVISSLSYLGDLSSLRVATVTGVVSASAFLLVVVVTKFRGMGLGDVKLAFLMGLLLGWPKTIVAFWSAFILGGITATILLLLKRTKISATIALGPFLVIGTLISALWSNRLLQLLGL